MADQGNVPLGDYIRWSELEGDDPLLDIATPTAEEIEQARLAAVIPLRFLLEAGLKEETDFIESP